MHTQNQTFDLTVTVMTALLSNEQDHCLQPRRYKCQALMSNQELRKGPLAPKRTPMCQGLNPNVPSVQWWALYCPRTQNLSKRWALNQDSQLPVRAIQLLVKTKYRQLQVLETLLISDYILLTNAHTLSFSVSFSLSLYEIILQCLFGFNYFTVCCYF